MQVDLPTPTFGGGYDGEARPRMGFFTDTSVCIGCKACEVACKEWNLVPEDGMVWTGESYDNTSELGANTWRHVAFIEQNEPLHGPPEDGVDALRWLMSSDVCKHCTHGLPRRLPDRGALPHRVRHRRRAGGHLQRLRLLRPGMPVRRARQASSRA